MSKTRVTSGIREKEAVFRKKLPVLKEEFLQPCRAGLVGSDVENEERTTPIGDLFAHSLSDRLEGLHDGESGRVRFGVPPIFSAHDHR